MPSPKQRNYEEIYRLEQLLIELRANQSTARKTESIREHGIEIALGVREVGAMLVREDWYAAHKPAEL